MTDSEIIHRILYYGIVEIRARSAENGDKASYVLADILHKLPLMMARVVAGETDYSSILKEFENETRQKGGEGWLTARLQQLRERK
jgi:hypothetical protein